MDKKKDSEYVAHVLYTVSKNTGSELQKNNPVTEYDTVLPDWVKFFSATGYILFSFYIFDKSMDMAFFNIDMA